MLVSAVRPLSMTVRGGEVQGDRTLETLKAVWAWEEKAEHGWVLDAAAPSFQRRARALAGEGLVETAGRETRAELSAWEGRPVRWAVRLSATGHDLLAYAGVRPAPTRLGPGPGERLVELAPSQMAALRVFVGLAGQLKSPPAPGLAEQVRTAVYDRGVRRWQLHLTQVQMESAAYGFWLHRLTGSAAEANRFSREYKVVFAPGPKSSGSAAIS
ncbi:DUF6417 family protein [Streptomyces rishiriensis]|uniref:Uncharacterized protein n=1 Tax=Streptomyces rishiriensis TaxID=68264 RepID=A0ABU0NG68_STRRH|nr:DUF6417 family protein [Streptomyces rishiriensis]MDQ0578089.1 hypothetical protein [Streptomyces rishiriensis]